MTKVSSLPSLLIVTCRLVLSDSFYLRPAPTICLPLHQVHDRQRRPSSAIVRLSSNDDSSPSVIQPRRSRERAERTRRPPPDRRSSSRSRSSTRDTTPRRAPHQFDHRKEEARPFIEDGAAAVQRQLPNEDAPLFSLPNELRSQDAELALPRNDGAWSHFRHVSLDEVFPSLAARGLSDKFHANQDNFRTDLRDAIRRDIFESTPAYANMSDKARAVLLLPDSSLQGSWTCRQTSDPRGRMKRLTNLLQKHFANADHHDDSHDAPNIPTGDEFMETLGSLCNAPEQEHSGNLSTRHWIDIVGIMDRKIPHSWHQDTATSPQMPTLLLGFPKQDNYEGTGVFSHFVKLQHANVKPTTTTTIVPGGEPVVYPKLAIEEEYIVRPIFGKGKEILLFRDVDVLHSSPDIAYRTSLMRFMS